MKKQEFNPNVARQYGGETLININHLDLLPLETRLNISAAIKNAGETYNSPEFIGFNEGNKTQVSLYSIYPNYKNNEEIWICQTVDRGWSETKINCFDNNYDKLTIEKGLTEKIQEKTGCYPEENEYYSNEFDINWSNITNSETLNFDTLRDNRYSVIQVNIEDAFKLTGDSYRLDINSDTGGDNAINDRLEKTKEYYMSGEPMDYPIIEYNSLNEEVVFTNGRHRTLAASHLGCSYIPMLVFNKNLDEFKSKIRTKGIEEPLEKAKYTYDPNDKLKINWVNDRNANEEIQNIFKNDTHVLLQVNVESAFSEIRDNQTEEDLYFKPGRDNTLSSKIEYKKDLLLNKELMNFPVMSSNKVFDSVKINSGKETIIAAYDLGCKYIPMMVDKQDIDHFKSIVETKGMNERLDTPVISEENKQSIRFKKPNPF